MDCEVHSVAVSWQPSAGAAFYDTVFTSSSGHMASCSTNLTSCQQSSLQCGEEYNVTVVAAGETCNSSAQMAGHLTTGAAICVSIQVCLEQIIYEYVPPQLPACPLRLMLKSAVSLTVTLPCPGVQLMAQQMFP